MSHINFFLRLNIFFYVYMHAIYFWQGAVSLPLAWFLFFLSYAVAFFYKKDFTLKIKVIFLLALPTIFLLIRIILWSIDLWRVADFSTLLAKWDLTYMPMRIPLLFIFYSTILFNKSLRYQILELSLRPFLFFILFWDMRNFHLGIYPNLMTLLGSLLLYGVLEITFLSRLLNSKAGRKNMFFIAMKVIIFSLITSLLALPWIYKKANPHIKMKEGLLTSTLNSLDFSDRLPLESDISLGNKLLFLVKSNEILTNDILLKRLTLSDYHEKKGFTRNLIIDDYFEAKQGTKLSFVEDLSKDQNIEQTLDFYILQLSEYIILTPYNPVSYEKLSFQERHSFKQIFQIKSNRPQLEKEDIYLQESTLPKNMEFAESVYRNESGISPEIARLAEDITVGIEGDYAKMLAIQAYFHENFYYTLNPGAPASKDLLHYFLFESKRGYCSYFATAMVLMARSLGMNARVAGGFRLLADNQFLDFYAVTAAESHAWVEIYFNESGWVTFDPTSPRLYNHDLYLDNTSEIAEEIYQVIYNINNLNLIKNQDGFTYIHAQHEFKINYIFILYIVIAIIMFFIISIVVKIMIFRNITDLNKKLKIWINLLNYPREPDWRMILYKNNKHKATVYKLLFTRSLLTVDEIKDIKDHLYQCYLFYRKLPIDRQVIKFLKLPMRKR
ncbi:transglutaminase-like domain-containing protein [Entomospira culicis]|uniref:Transglutaminase domain-containing protein n=1 Tax=Entomospira culicis TaxID=2719989 RepID=A0A968GHW5_9SPIO|nr:transglutaminase-like domain-containing protein [Entomospira culicis]NIZ19118.1 transglutaminase domain-containing protein [Entomospira culicis]NIZ69332.1 transglutaminase domain-containing protein [Entomospira culicis]WDI37918.1 transglutaminase-like domain-containing protein [Entomospira culicis]WDI39545.1 transglutaminase-like domain-containing protein [Entomospira culicis]